MSRAHLTIVVASFLLPWMSSCRGPAPVEISIEEPDSVFESNDQVAFVIRVSGARADETVTVHYETKDGTAKSGLDNEYESRSDTLSFNPDETIKTITVPLHDDETNEIDKSFFLVLSDAEGAHLAKTSAEALIKDDDGMPAITIVDVSDSEEAGELLFTVTLSEATQQRVAVDYETNDDSATSFEDYEPADDTLTFEPLETSKTISVVVENDEVIESDETLELTLSNAQNASIMRSNADGIILNDDIIESQVSVGDNHTCALRSNGSIWCWGQNTLGQLADFTIDKQSNVPNRVGTITNWRSLSAGSAHNCATRTNNTLWCWGYNYDGQLGNGSTSNYSSPRQVGTSVWASASGSDFHSCATRLNNTLWCWGANDDGQLGDGSTTEVHSPKQVGSLTNWRTVSTGWSFSCAIKTDNTLWCWGNNSTGQLGDGSTTEIHSPKQVGSHTNWKTADAGFGYACATKTDNTLWCWGKNNNGELGDGSTIEVHAPKQVASLTNWSAVSVGFNHTCAIKTDNTLWCWGNNNNGQLGDGTTNDALMPEQVGNLADWKKISVEYLHTCSTKTDNSIWCWGRNSYGQLGDDTTTQRNSPKRIVFSDN